MNFIKENSLQMPTRKPQISVIVPVYKAENYLNRCMDSLLAQTFKDFEILLIDDGSPDKSGEMCDEYARRDSRVRVFHKENGGVSSARQMGMDNAQGEYTIHADPDDWVEPDMLEELYNKAKETDADMVICDFFFEYKLGGVICKQAPRCCTAEAIQEELFRQQLHGACWNKLIRRSCYEEYGVKFPSNVILWEDLYVICSLLSHPLKVAYFPKAFYHYDQVSNSDSIVRKPTMKGLNSRFLFIEHFKKLGYPFDILYSSMRGAKVMAYASGLLSNQEIVNLYSEVNETYLKEDPNDWVLKGLQELIKGNSLKSAYYKCLIHCYRYLYHCYLCIKKKS